jgi:hypothetical protein
MSEVRGFKVFNKDWTCRGYQFEVGKTFEEDVTPECCNSGFHFCLKAADCFSYYAFNPDNKVAEVVAIGEMDQESGDSKCATNKIHIVREIPWQEVLEIVNTGKACTGLGNTGDRNTGDRNTGDMNTGDRNTGDRNTGDWNTGDMNTGDRNTGDWNTGDMNTGDRNTGDRNTGDRNTGDRNTGDWNTGNRNTGDRNTGDRNTGNRNTGDWNNSSFNTGCFNTDKHPLLFFDKPTNMSFEEWRRSYAYYLLNRIDFNTTEWVWYSDMTAEEKAEHPEYDTMGGYLKELDGKMCCLDWWKRLTMDQKCCIQNIPNFDADKFFQITGIKVDE